MKFSKLLSWLGMTAATAAYHPAFSGDPPLLADSPVSFGYKMNWFAIRSSDTRPVLAAIGAHDPTPANWATGISAAYESVRAPKKEPPLVYVTAPIDGWVFVVGANLPLPDHRKSRTAAERQEAQQFDTIFALLYGKFPEVQFFTTHRVIGLDGWARARAGRVERVFRMELENGEVYANDGQQSAEEKQLKMLDISGLSTGGARDTLFAAAERRNTKVERLVAQSKNREQVEAEVSGEQRDPLPSEDDTMAVAGAWSVDPSILEQRTFTPSSGFIAHLRATSSARSAH